MAFFSHERPPSPNPFRRVRLRVRLLAVYIRGSLSQQRLSRWNSVFKAYEKEIKGDDVYKAKPTPAQASAMFKAAHAKVQAKIEAARDAEYAAAVAAAAAAGEKKPRKRKRASEARSPVSQYNKMDNTGGFFAKKPRKKRRRRSPRRDA